MAYMDELRLRDGVTIPVPGEGGNVEAHGTIVALNKKPPEDSYNESVRVQLDDGSLIVCSPRHITLDVGES